MFMPAWQQKCQSLETLINMIIRLANYYKQNGDHASAAHQIKQGKAILEIFRDDIVPPFWKNSIYEDPGLELLKQLNIE